MAWGAGDAGGRLAVFSIQCSDPKEEPTLLKRLLFPGNPATRWGGRGKATSDIKRKGTVLSVMLN